MRRIVTGQGESGTAVLAPDKRPVWASRKVCVLDAGVELAEASRDRDHPSRRAPSFSAPAMVNRMALSPSD